MSRVVYGRLRRLTHQPCRLALVSLPLLGLCAIAHIRNKHIRRCRFGSLTIARSSVGVEELVSLYILTDECASFLLPIVEVLFGHVGL
ncbi:hypothetical protein HD806DRAFT_510928 [Xylariaceae sp. AK1471]|nr:hypothetical protein HD806DRAFT_510928 [Xylariaceae sp. AK1471]